MAKIPPRPSDWDRRLDLESQYEDDIEYRRVIVWSDGTRSPGPPLSKLHAEESTDWHRDYLATYAESKNREPVAVLLESRFVQGWEEERREPVARPRGAATLQQEELFA